MTERPQLSVVGGGKGEAPAQPTAPTHLEARLAADLRAQRELNADLALDLGAARAAVALAARRQEDLLTQLQLEREARRQMKLQFRERDAEARALAERLRIAEEAGQAAERDNIELAARVEALAEQERASGEAIVYLEALLGKRDEQIALLRTGLGNQAAKQNELGERIAQVLAESEKAAAKARAAVTANADLSAQVRAFILALSEAINLRDPAALDPADGMLATSFAAIVDQAAQLYDACAVAQADIAALRAEKAAINAQLGEATLQLGDTAAKLADMTAQYADMSTKADNRFLRLSRNAEELTALRDTLAQRDQLAGKLEASLKERDAAIKKMMQDGKRLQGDLEAEKTRASHLDKKVAKKDELLMAATTEARQREAELLKELARAGNVADELMKKLAAIELENARLTQAEQSLGGELAEMNTVLDERRKTIRQLQQELALIKLGRKKPVPEG